MPTLEQQIEALESLEGLSPEQVDRLRYLYAEQDAALAAEEAALLNPTSLDVNESAESLPTPPKPRRRRRRPSIVVVDGVEEAQPSLVAEVSRHVATRHVHSKKTSAIDTLSLVGGILGEAVFVAVRDWLDTTVEHVPELSKEDMQLFNEEDQRLRTVSQTAKPLGAFPSPDFDETMIDDDYVAKRRQSRSNSIKSLVRSKSVKDLVQDFRLSNDTEEAEKLMRERLNVRKEMYGPQHVAVAHARNQLGGLLAESGRLEGAVKQFRKAEKLLKKHPSERVMVLMNLAVTLRAKQDYQAAKAVAELALECGGSKDTSRAPLLHALIRKPRRGSIDERAAHLAHSPIKSDVRDERDSDEDDSDADGPPPRLEIRSEQVHEDEDDATPPGSSPVTPASALANPFLSTCGFGGGSQTSSEPSTLPGYERIDPSTYGTPRAQTPTSIGPRASASVVSSATSKVVKAPSVKFSENASTEEYSEWRDDEQMSTSGML